MNPEQKQNDEILRVCKDCNKVKPIIEFPQNRNKKSSSYRHRCIECEKVLKREQNKKYYQKKKNSKENKTDNI